MMFEFDPERITKVAKSDPHISDFENFENFVNHNYNLNNNAFSQIVYDDNDGPDDDTYDVEISKNIYEIRGVTSRPGMGSATLGRETMRNRPNEDGEYEVYRGDPIPLKTYQKMSADPDIAFGTFLLKGWVGGLPYTIETSDKMIKGVVEHILDGLWKDLVRNMLDAIRTGFSFGEKVWERKDVIIVAEDDDGNEEVIYDGKIASLEKVKFLNPTHNFTFYKRNDEISRVEQQQLTKKVSVDRDKIVWFTLDQEYSSVFGRSRFKNIYSEWYYSNINIQYMLNDLQKRGSPHLEVRFPPGRTRLDDGTMINNAELAMNIVKKLQSDGIVAIPSSHDDDGNKQWEVKYADTRQNESGSPFLEFLKHSSSKKMRGLGIPPSVVDEDSNFSNADAGGDLLIVIVEDIVNQLEDKIQKEVVDYIVDFNFGPKKKSLVQLKIDKSALGRRKLMKEILKTMIRTGSSFNGHTLKSWPDPAAMMNELGMTSGTFSDIFLEVEGADRRPGETPVDEAERDEDSNTDRRRDEPDDRERDRASEDDSVTESD